MRHEIFEGLGCGLGIRGSASVKRPLSHFCIVLYVLFRCLVLPHIQRLVDAPVDPVTFATAASRLPKSWDEKWKRELTCAVFRKHGVSNSFSRYATRMSRGKCGACTSRDPTAMLRGLRSRCTATKHPER